MAFYCPWFGINEQFVSNSTKTKAFETFPFLTKKTGTHCPTGPLPHWTWETVSWSHSTLGIAMIGKDMVWIGTDKMGQVWVEYISKDIFSSIRMHKMTLEYVHAHISNTKTFMIKHYIHYMHIASGEQGRNGIADCNLTWGMFEISHLEKDLKSEMQVKHALLEQCHLYRTFGRLCPDLVRRQRRWHREIAAHGTHCYVCLWWCLPWGPPVHQVPWHKWMGTKAFFLSCFFFVLWLKMNGVRLTSHLSHWFAFFMEWHFQILPFPIGSIWTARRVNPRRWWKCHCFGSCIHTTGSTRNEWTQPCLRRPTPRNMEPQQIKTLHAEIYVSS